MKIKLSQWAKKNGFEYRTAWNWFINGQMPADVEAERLPSGAIYVVEKGKKCPHCGKEIENV